VKKIKLDMEKAVSVYNIISKLLSYNGIDRKKVYWLDRNRDWLKPSIEKWFKKAQEIIQQYSIETPQNPFIPLTKYQAFKKELKETLSSVTFHLLEPTKENAPLDKLKEVWESVNLVFEKYEIHANFKSGIPVEKKEEYQKAIKEAMEAMPEVEYDYMEIVSDRVFDQVLQNLTGEEIVAIEFMLEEPSTVHVAQGTVLM